MSTMDNISICVAFITAILGIAYPILLQVITRLDERYSSQIIIDLYSRENSGKMFTKSIIAGLICLMLYMLQLPRLGDWGWFNVVIDHSAMIILVGATTILVGFFLYHISNILLYNNLRKFIPYLINKHVTRKSNENYDYFIAISDLLLFSIRNQNEKLAKTIADFMALEFKKVRDAAPKQQVTYPLDYYQIIYNSIEELGSTRNKRLIFLEHRTGSNIWLLGEFESSIISENTYTWMWRNLVLSLNYERSDFVMHHWENAHQYISYSLNHIRPQYRDDLSIINEEEVNALKKYRLKFLEFHIALGGLLLYTKQYKTLRKAFTFTQSEPPSYELLPTTMGEVFYWFMWFRDPYDMNFPWITTMYYLPGTSGVHASAIVKKWICQYTALLFLRQYTIVAYYVYMDPVGFPAIPVKQGEKQSWLDNLKVFKFHLNDILTNKELLVTVGFDHITEEWCESKKILPPLKYIDELQKRIEQDFERVQIEQGVSNKKKQQFKDGSAEILSEAIEEYALLKNETEYSGDVTKRYIHGVNQLIEKSAFAEDQESEHLNFHTIVAELVTEKIRNGVSEIFSMMNTKYYLLKTDDIVPTLRKLGIDTEDHLIVSFGVNINEKLSSTELSEIEVISFRHRNFHLVGDSIFIINKKELPRLIFRNPSADEIQNYSLEPIIDQCHVYAGITDLNLNEQLRRNIEETEQAQHLRKSVVASIFIKLETQWKTGIECVQLEQASSYRERGLINKIEDIQPFRNRSQE